MLRRVLNGCNGNVSFLKKPVYHHWEKGEYEESVLGEKIDKDAWVEANITDRSRLKMVQDMLVDWQLFENGWLVDGYTEKSLYYYLAHIGRNYRPEALKFIKKIAVKPPPATLEVPSEPTAPAAARLEPRTCDDHKISKAAQ